jgi:Chalcone isomerase-like
VHQRVRENNKTNDRSIFKIMTRLHFIRTRLIPLLLLASGLGGLPAHAQPSSGTRPGVELKGTPLIHNGSGIRYKAVFKVYEASLYLTRKAGTPDEVMAAPGPKRLHIQMLREIDAGELGKLFTRGVEDNALKGEMSRLVPGLIRMGQVFSDQKKLKSGDTFTIDWVPGQGTLITVKGVQQGEPFKEPEFFAALMRIWLGNSPADWQLKDALLGKTGAS